MSVCELRETDKKLELERNEKTLTKQEELRKMVEICRFLYSFGRVHILLVLYASGCLIFCFKPFAF